MRHFVLLLAGLAAVTSGSFGKPQEVSGTWEHVSSGILPLSRSGHLRVVTRGAVVMRGAATDQIRYVLQVRADGVSQREAERFTKTQLLRSRTVNGWTELTVAYTARAPILSRLEISTLR